MMNADSRIYVAGFGMVGQPCGPRGCGPTDPITFTSAELDLRDQTAVQKMMERERPTHVFVAAEQGGIYANNVMRAEFPYDNLNIEANLIHAAMRWRWRTPSWFELHLSETCEQP